MFKDNLMRMLVHRNKATTSKEISTHLLEQQQQRWFNGLDTAFLHIYQLTFHYLEQSLVIPDKNTAMFSFFDEKRVKNVFTDSGNLVWFFVQISSKTEKKLWILLKKSSFTPLSSGNSKDQEEDTNIFLMIRFSYNF